MRLLTTVRPALLLALVTSCGGGTTGPIVQQPGGGGTTSVANASVTNITIEDFMFSPATVTVKVGSTVKWTNNGPSSHTTTSDAGAWDSGPLSAPMSGNGYGGGGSAAGTFQFTFNQTGTFGYHCRIHPPSAYPGFIGTVTVTQ
jgi:plastocyanin